MSDCRGCVGKECGGFVKECDEEVRGMIAVPVECCGSAGDVWPEEP